MEAIQRFRERRDARLKARMDAEPDSWITVNGNHIPLDEEKKPIGGQLKAFGEENGSKQGYDMEGVSNRTEFVRKNKDRLEQIYKNEGSEGLDLAYYRALEENSTKNLSEIKPVETGLKSIDRKEAIHAAMDTLVEEVGDSKLAGWLRNADSGYKPQIMEGILRSPDARNAAMNIMYRIFQYEKDPEEKVSFEEFLNTPIKLYRGETGKKRVKDDVFSSYSFDNRMAKRFAGENGIVHEIEVKPIETLGSPRDAGEAEVMVPYWVERRFRKLDSKMDGVERFRKRRADRLSKRADDEIWRTTENGKHYAIETETGEITKGNIGQDDPPKHKVAQGKDISKTYRRRESDFKYEINDVINQQGFDGLPKVVDDDEFEKAVKESNFVAQRTYSAPSKEILDAYREALYNGDWYVDCSEGGAAYGRGMYCAADFDGELSGRTEGEIGYYRGIGDANYGKRDQEQIDKAVEVMMDRDEYPKNYEWLEELPTKEVRKFWQDRFSVMHAEDIEEMTGVKGSNRDAPDYVETFTMSKDANIIDYDELEEEYNEYKHDWEVERADRVRAKIRDNPKGLRDIGTLAKRLSGDEGVSDDDAERFAEMVLFSDDFDAQDDFVEKHNCPKLRDEILEVFASIRGSEALSENMVKDIGSYAALKGYDAIKAPGGYAVILNRTKVIFKKPRRDG